MRQHGQVPSLWRSAEKNAHFGPTLPRQWFDAYRAAGAPGEWVQFPPVGLPGDNPARASEASAPEAGAVPR